MSFKRGHYWILRNSIFLLGSQIWALRLHLPELKDTCSLGLIKVQVLLSVKEGLAHIHLVGLLIASRVMLEVNHPRVLRAWVVRREIVVGFETQIVSIASRDFRSCHLQVEVYKTLGTLVHMIYRKKHLRGLCILVRTTVSTHLSLWAATGCYTGFPQSSLPKVVPTCQRWHIWTVLITPHELIVKQRRPSVVSSDPVWGRLALLSGAFLSVLDEATEMVPALTGMLPFHHLQAESVIM